MVVELAQVVPEMNQEVAQEPQRRCARVALRKPGERGSELIGPYTPQGIADGAPNLRDLLDQLCPGHPASGELRLAVPHIPASAQVGANPMVEIAHDVKSQGPAGVEDPRPQCPKRIIIRIGGYLFAQARQVAVKVVGQLVQHGVQEWVLQRFRLA